MKILNLFELTIEVTVLVAIIQIVRKVFHKQLNPNIRYFLWIFVALRVLVPIQLEVSYYVPRALADNKMISYIIAVDDIGDINGLDNRSSSEGEVENDGDITNGNIKPRNANAAVGEMAGTLSENGMSGTSSESEMAENVAIDTGAGDSSAGMISGASQTTENAVNTFNGSESENSVLADSVDQTSGQTFNLPVSYVDVFSENDPSENSSSANGGMADSVDNMVDTVESERIEDDSVVLRFVKILYRVWFAGVIFFAISILVNNIRFYHMVKKERRELKLLSNGLKLYELSGYNCLFGIFHPAVYVSYGTDKAPEERKPQSASDRKGNAIEPLDNTSSVDQRIAKTVVEADVEAKTGFADPEQTTAHIITHELEHYRVKDHIWQLVRVICLVLQWLNPFMWWAYISSKRDCELACDYRTTKDMNKDERYAYGMSLLQVLMDHAGRKDYMTLATSMGDSRKFQSERIQTIMKGKYKKNILLPVGITAVIGIVLILSVKLHAGDQASTLELENMDSNLSDSKSGEDGEGSGRGEELSDDEALMSDGMKQYAYEVHIEDYYITNIGTGPNLYYVDENNVLWGSGDNDYGQLGQGTADGEYHPEMIKIAEDVIHVDASQSGFVVYLTNDHELYGLGNRESGALLDMDEFEYENFHTMPHGDCAVSTPVFLMDHVKYVRCGRDDVACMKEDNSVWIWGLIGVSNTHSWFGPPEDLCFEASPCQVLENAVLVTGGRFNHAALLADGSVWTWGYNYSGNCGVPESSFVGTPAKVAEDVSFVWTGNAVYDVDCQDITKLTSDQIWSYDNTVIRKEDGTHLVCGADVGSVEKVLPTYYEASDFSMACTFEFMDLEEEYVRHPVLQGLKDSIARMEEMENLPELARETPEIRNQTPDIRIEDYYKTEDSMLTELGKTTYFIDEDHVLWGSGRNDSGQLGLGYADSNEYSDNIKIAEGVIHVDCWNGYVIYLTENHELYGMGTDRSGALQAYPDQPLDVTRWWNPGNYIVAKPKLLMEDVEYASCGGAGDVVCMKSDGSVWIWGATVFVWESTRAQIVSRELQDTIAGMFHPEPYKVLENAVLVTGNANHAALLKDGSVWTWGINTVGNCCVPDSDYVLLPVKVADDAVCVWTGSYQEKEIQGTVIEKLDGSILECGLGVGDETHYIKNLPMSINGGGIVICSYEFLPYEEGVRQSPYITNLDSAGIYKNLKNSIWEMAGDIGDEFVLHEQKIYRTYISEDGHIHLLYSMDGEMDWEQTVIGDTVDAAGHVLVSFEDPMTGHILYWTVRETQITKKVLYVTLDGGKTFEQQEKITAGVAGNPTDILYTTLGTGYIAVAAKNPSECLYRYEEENGWTPVPLQLELPMEDYMYVRGFLEKEKDGYRFDLEVVDGVQESTYYSYISSNGLDWTLKEAVE